MKEFSLNEEGELYIQWSINTSYTKLSFNQLITELIREYKNTGGVYDAFIQNDGKLIGHEKVVIIRNMKDIIEIAIILRNLLNEKYIKKQSDSAFFKLVFLDQYSFQLTYQFNKKEIDSMDSVKQWYNQFLKVQVISFTEELKHALEDKIIHEHEAFALSNKLEEIILSTAILYHKLSYENISE